MRRLLSLGLLCLSLAACGTTQLAMPYRPAVPPVVQPGARPVIAVGTVVDRREDGKEDANWIGTIRGGYGNPLKRLETPVPVTEVVRKAFADALAARGLLAASAPRYLLNVDVLQLSSSQYQRREATVEFRIALAPALSGAPVYGDQERAYVVDGSAFTLASGAFGSVDELHRVALQAMNEAVDRVLNKPGLAAAAR
jgi:hypothetical protein